MTYKSCVVIHLYRAEKIFISVRVLLLYILSTRIKSASWCMQPHGFGSGTEPDSQVDVSLPLCPRRESGLEPSGPWTGGGGSGA